MASSTALLRVTGRSATLPAIGAVTVTTPRSVADKARSRHSGGFGLGLSIALAIAQSHSDNIQVRLNERVADEFG